MDILVAADLCRVCAWALALIAILSPINHVLYKFCRVHCWCEGFRQRNRRRLQCCRWVCDEVSFVLWKNFNRLHYLSSTESLPPRTTKKFRKKFSSRAGREKSEHSALFRERKSAFFRFLLFGVPVWKFSTQTLSRVLCEKYRVWRFSFFLGLSQLFWDSCRSICSRKVLCQVRVLRCFEISGGKWEKSQGVRESEREWKLLKNCFDYKVFMLQEKNIEAHIG